MVSRLELKRGRIIPLCRALNKLCTSSSFAPAPAHRKVCGNKSKKRLGGWRPGLTGPLLQRTSHQRCHSVIELFLAVCLIDHPETCKDVSLIYSAEALTPMQCAMQAQPEIAKWLTEHPGWVTKRYTCRLAGRYAKT